MDLVALVVEIGFDGSLAAAGVLLLLAYLAFARMNRDVRRARMFIMADRVERFLGAFTVGILFLAAVVFLGSVGLSSVVVSAVAIFVFLGAIVYGSLEMFLIIRPRKSHFSSLRRASPQAAAADAPSTLAPEDSAEGDTHATR